MPSGITFRKHDEMGGGPRRLRDTIFVMLSEAVQSTEISLKLFCSMFRRCVFLNFGINLSCVIERTGVFFA